MRNQKANRRRKKSAAATQKWQRMCDDAQCCMVVPQTAKTLSIHVVIISALTWQLLFVSIVIIIVMRRVCSFVVINITRAYAVWLHSYAEPFALSLAHSRVVDVIYGRCQAYAYAMRTEEAER